MIKWGIIGLGNMANHFANSINEIDNSKLTAISSSSNFKLKKFGTNFSIDEKNRYNNYLDIINSDIDAIYISTLNNSHAKLIEASIKSKKKVLCEKPFVMNYEEAKHLSKLIKVEDNNFYEAIAYRSHPQTKQIISLIKEDEIGEIKKIESTFGFKVKKINQKSRLFNKELGGGAILDIGCYPISFAKLFCEKEETIKISKVSGNICKTDVDDHAELLGSINDNIEIDLKVSFKENYSNSCIIYGSKGMIKIASPWLPGKKSYLEINKNNSYYKKFVLSENSVYISQIKEVSDKFLKKNITNQYLIDINQSVDISKILSDWRGLIN